MRFSPSCVFKLSLLPTLLFPLLLQAQAAYDPPTTASFSQATSGMATINSYTFGTAAGSNISNLQQLAASFDPYGVAKQTVIHQEWERYQPFNSSNFVFTPSTLNMTATIPANGGLFPAGINSGQIWSKQTYQPGKSGQTVYAASVRMKFPSGVGMWPGIWFFSPVTGDGSEIDINEFSIMQWQNQYDWTGYNHGPGTGSIFYSQLSNPWTWHPGFDFSASFHDYQVIWTPDATYKYFDGQLIIAQFFNWTSNQQGQLGVNLAVGSSESDLPGLMPNSLSEFPAAMQVQAINVWGGATANPGPPSSPSTASYAGLDTTTQGTWSSRYGSTGYMIANDNNALPPYAAVSVAGGIPYNWAASSSDVRAPQTSPGSGSRIASTYYAGQGFAFNVNLTDGNTHQVALYLLDWDSTVRIQKITIIDASTRAVLDTQTFSNFHNGQYGVWNIKGNVVIQTTPAGYGNAVVSGIFFQ